MFSIRSMKFSTFLGVFGVVLLIAGVYINFFQSRGFMQTTGTIIEVVEDHLGDHPTYWPVVEYSVDGVTYSDQAAENCRYDSLGKTVTVLYNPENPAVFHVKKGMSIYMMVVGGVMLLIAIGSRIFRK